MICFLLLEKILGPLWVVVSNGRSWGGDGFVKLQDVGEFLAL